MKVNIKGIDLTPSQKELYEAVFSNKYKYILANYSRQQGKSTCLLLICLQWLLQKNEDIIYFTPTYQLGRNFFSKLQKLIPEQLLIKCNASELYIETITNSTIRFMSAEAAANVRGNNCTRLCIDEAAFTPEEIEGQSFYYNIVLPMMKVRGKTCVMISTPLNRSGFYYNLCMKALEGEKGYIYIKKTIYDDALISKEKIEELKKGYPELAWRTEFMCEFMTNALSVFPDYEKCFNKKFIFKNSFNYYVGVDLSTVGEDSTIVTVMNDSNQSIQFQIDGDLEMKYKKIAKVINEYKPKLTYIESNSIGTVMYNEIIKYCYRKSNIELYTTTNETKQNYVGKLSTMITNNEIEFDSENTRLFSEMGTFTYKITASKKLTFAAQQGKHDDSCMSLLICLAAKDDATLKSFTKNNYTFSNIRQHNLY